MKKNIPSISILIITSFVLHLIWESAHIRLYTGYEEIHGKLPVELWATLGDVGYVLLAFIIVCILRKDISFETLQKKHFLLLPFLGFSIALFVEYKAMLLQKWSYLEAMPIIPFLNVGLSPIAQMTILLPLSFWITWRTARPYHSS